MQEHIERIKEAIENNKTAVISAKCSVTYSGRVESFLPEGDRIIIMKSDGNLLVHKPKGTAPVNYMKEGTVHEVVKNEQGVFLKSKNTAMKDFMNIHLHKIHFVNSHILEDNEDISVAGTEKHMAEMIMENPKLIEEGFKPLNMEEHTKYGFIDVFGHDKKNILVVVECKRQIGDLKAVTQLRRYVEKIKELKGLKKVRGVLACPNISANAEAMLKDWGFEYRKVEPPRYFEKHKKNQKKLHEF
ncbi:endonuclease NucS [Candidatus Woesearchaeota archaeon]|nr:endonuclease NucS [Candidatus Woesearchaeota archaeon]